MDWIFLHEVRQVNEDKDDLDIALKVDFWPAKRHERNPVGFLTADDFAEWRRRNRRRALRLIALAAPKPCAKVGSGLDQRSLFAPHAGKGTNTGMRARSNGADRGLDIFYTKYAKVTKITITSFLSFATFARLG